MKAHEKRKNTIKEKVKQAKEKERVKATFFRMQRHNSEPMSSADFERISKY